MSHFCPIQAAIDGQISSHNYILSASVLKYVLMMK